MIVEKWMTPHPMTLPPQTTISAAALQMSRHKLRHLLVAETGALGKKLIGLLSKYDIARAFPHNLNPFSLEVSEDTVPQPISTIMVRNVISVEPYCALEEAARILRTRRINALPVVRGTLLIGIITETDVFDALLNMTGANGNGIKLMVESENVKTALFTITQLADQHHLIILNAMSFHDHQSENKVISVFHFSSRPDTQFVQKLCNLGFRLLKLG